MQILNVVFKIFENKLEYFEFYILFSMVDRCDKSYHDDSSEIKLTYRHGNASLHLKSKRGRKKKRHLSFSPSMVMCCPVTSFHQRRAQFSEV